MTEIGKEPAKKTAKGPKRIPLHKQRGYDYDGLGLDTKNFFYYWANGYEGNLASFETAGFSYVLDKDGKKVKKRMGRYQDGAQFLMRQPMKLHEEDALSLLEEPESIEREMRSKGFSGQQLGHGSDPRYLVGKVKIRSDNIDM